MPSSSRDLKDTVNGQDFDIDLVNPDTVLLHPPKVLFNSAIAINSTAFEDVDSKWCAIFHREKDQVGVVGIRKGARLAELQRYLCVSEQYRAPVELCSRAL
jgi:hypothetical protein